MKKGKVFGKNQVAITAMVLALAVAIWLNMKYTPSTDKLLGEASLVNAGSGSSQSTQTSAKTETTEDYFETTKKEREKAREEAQDLIKETLNEKSLTEEDKKSALKKTEELAKRIETESNIESILVAKGFKKAVAVISDSGINVIVKSDGLTSVQTLQIQDIVTSETNIKLSNIKIIPVK